MRKLRLKQPYASMVVAGVLDTIPDIWGDVKYAEKIFIYADEVDEDIKDGIEYDKEVHRKVHNEMLYGNISDEEFPINTYLGYVIISYKGTDLRYWNSGESLLFVNNPHTFIKEFIDYEERYDVLNYASSCESKPHRMKMINHCLTVPVCEDTWNSLRNKEEYKHVFFFWEDYMKQFATPNFLADERKEEQIYSVKFINKKKSITFEVGDEIGYRLRVYTDEKSGKKCPLYLFYLDLRTISPYSQYDFIDEKSSSPKKKKRERIQIIYTPMGGMTKWKRK